MPCAALLPQQTSFFEKQDILKFEKVWSYRDNVYLKSNEPDIEYLERFEKNYSINLWKLAYRERVFYKYIKYHKFSNE